ncbi:4Fe-4S binding protein [Clostridium sp. OS1-26]|uniref:4Fe-4S binding protein n=1 Tax=Clostridium sp. OS1-26 TaxID=3070681 RepID=UPI0027E08D67|nr:4Fe-4S binding protein [Clostridium sp. OS1-26]WML34760.1 4Fe-4S binding protein [Clostridium sp. OS1-26]
MDKIKRKLVQIITLISTNGYFKGFLEGSIYSGKLKSICVPGLNCYSCPGAFGACPIGSLQAVISDIKYKFSFYIVGFLTLMGVTMGRFICGWLCPFGLIQELLNKIPSPKFKVSKRFEKLKYLKYIILLVFVILLPMFWVNDVGMGSPTFCKYICPAGTLEGGIPLTLLDTSLRSAVGFLFAWKLTLLIITIILSIIIFRPFCRFICPLGAIYSIFNPISIYRLKIDKDKCTSCGACTKKCKMDIEVYKKPNSLECIRCGECKSACSQGAIKTLISMKDTK